MVGIAFTGRGKTVTFSLPLIMAALEEEARMPLKGGEGPVGIIMAPSRELVKQTYAIVEWAYQMERGTMGMVIVGEFADELRVQERISTGW